jgi:hypothetical protein
MLGVTARDPLTFTALVELLDRIGAGRVKQPEPRPGAADIRDNQRFRHQIGQAVDRINTCCCRIHGNGRGCLDGKAAREYAEGAERSLLVLAEQTVAPVDDSLHGLVPRHACSPLRSYQPP